MTKYFLFLCLLLTAGTSAQEQKTDSLRLQLVMEQLNDFEPVDRDQYPLGLYTKARYEEEARFAREQLAALEQIQPQNLTERDLISWELLKFTLQEPIDRFRFKTYLNPIQADQGFHLNLNYRIRPIRNYAEARRYLQVLRAIPDFAAQHFTLMREGLKLGISQPKVIFKGYEATYEDHIVSDYRESAFYQPFKDLPDGMPQTRKDSILAAAREAIEESVIPSFEKIKAFFEVEYLPATRNAIGVSNIPDGPEFYQNRIDYFTTSKVYTADKIHQIGLEEVARIRREMQDIIKNLGFEGDFKAFLNFLRTDPQFYVDTPQELLMHARDIAKRIDGELPRFFKTLPRRPYGVKPVPDAIAPKYTGGRYSPPRGEQASGTYLVNTYKLDSRPLYTLPALTAHEAMPGHHLQGALNRELSEEIPAFRRRLYLSAFGEGWGLYSEYLAAEMGIYRTPYEKFGQLTYEMWRACRLVVDTGIHAKGWTREQAVAFMRDNTALSLHEINTETDRYIAWPGQALSYKMGEIAIRELRETAQKTLGEAFDIRSFHECILGEGTVTLPILKRRVTQYITEQQTP